MIAIMPSGAQGSLIVSQLMMRSLRSLQIEDKQKPGIGPAAILRIFGKQVSSTCTSDRASDNPMVGQNQDIGSM